MPARMSVATIDSPEFLNISSINPLISKCEIKVLYVGENRNRSYISKEVATEMAATLPGTPIVGHFVDRKEDFGDHGEQIIIDDEGVKFNTLTVPYGFVAPDTKIWFQKFEDTDDFGNTVVREYLMTEGYLWTGQFEECKRVLEYGNPHSMELDEETLKGYWSEDVNRGVEFFIINDAIFSKLCILGEDVEPCFEGSDITSPKMSSKFSKDESFNKTLYTMMQELKNALKGEDIMEDEKIVVEEASTDFSENSQDKVDETIVEKIEENIEDTTSETVEESPVSEEVEVAEETSTEDVVEVDATETEFAKAEQAVADDVIDEEETPAEYANAKKEEEEEAQEEKADEKESDEKSEDEKSAKEEEDEEKKKYALLEQKYVELESKYSALEIEYQKLSAFKADKDKEAKDELISSFSMQLTDAEMKDVIDNKAQFSLDEIESKLSVIYSRKQRAQGIKTDKVETEAPVIYTVQDDCSSNPDWVNEVLNYQKTM